MESRIKRLAVSLVQIVCCLIILIFGINSAEAFDEEQKPSAFIGRSVTEKMADKGLVSTSDGIIEGYKLAGVYRFLGIPYAEAKERFVPAEPVTPWKGIYAADSYGPISYQGYAVGIQKENGDNNSNNCQNLNIWTPSLEEGANKPVMVWLHGGGFSFGSANETYYSGFYLAKKKDVIVVGVNHRLNVFGHLDLSGFGEKYRFSSNIGLIDIQMALMWIRDNISLFGGDPDNVTLFGQSGGGAKILALMASPKAQGLFHKAIVQSGANLVMGVHFTGKGISRRIGSLTCEYLGLDGSTIEDIQFIPYEDIMAAADRARIVAGREFGLHLSLSEAPGVEWGPVIDGYYMPTDPVTKNSFAEPGKDIPLLIGSNFSEWTHMKKNSEHKDMTPEQIQAFKKAYPERDEADAPFVDSYIRIAVLDIIMHKARQGGAEVYSYVYNYGEDPYHSSELEAVFGRESTGPGVSVCEAWTNFAKTGKPCAKGFPEWEPFTLEGGATLIIDEQSRIAYWHDRELMELLDPDYTY